MERRAPEEKANRQRRAGNRRGQDHTRELGPNEPGPPAARVPIALRPPRGETYFAIENSRGEYGFYLTSDGGEYPWRAKMRAPSFVNLQMLPELLRGYKMSDAVAIIGSFDIVLGCVDR